MKNLFRVIIFGLTLVFSFVMVLTLIGLFSIFLVIGFARQLKINIDKEGLKNDK